MSRQTVRYLVAFPILIAHAASFFWIMWVKAEWTSPAQRQDIALLLLPLTAAYFVAIVRSAIDEKNNSMNGPPVNLFYSLVVITVTVITISALIFTITQIPSAMVPTIDDARRTILIFEIAFGTAFGLIASDLFGKIENVQIPIGSLKDGA